MAGGRGAVCREKGSGKAVDLGRGEGGSAQGPVARGLRVAVLGAGGEEGGTGPTCGARRRGWQFKGPGSRAGLLFPLSEGGCLSGRGRQPGRGAAEGLVRAKDVAPSQAGTETPSGGGAAPVSGQRPRRNAERKLGAAPTAGAPAAEVTACACLIALSFDLHLCLKGPRESQDGGEHVSYDGCAARDPQSSQRARAFSFSLNWAAFSRALYCLISTT